jgi:hypothetical protein
MVRAAQPNTNIFEEELDTDILEVRAKSSAGFPVLIDPVEKRNQFFRLKEGDLKGLLDFLNSVGLFETAHYAASFQQPRATVLVSLEEQVLIPVDYVRQISAKHIWKMQKLIQHRLEEHKKTELGNFLGRFERWEGKARFVLTTYTFIDSLYLTVHVDRVKRMKVQKCARADCGIPFTASSGHAKKYCERACAHLESVRRSRKRTRDLINQQRSGQKLTLWPSNSLAPKRASKGGMSK